MPETRHFCPHCEETVSLSTFHRHKQLYYDSKHHQWIKSDVRDSSEDDVEAGDDGGEVLEFDSDHSLGIHSEDALEGNDSLGLCINISFLFCIL